MVFLFLFFNEELVNLALASNNLPICNLILEKYQKAKQQNDS